MSSALRLAKQAAREIGTEIMILSEPPSTQSDNSRWVTATDGTCVVALTDSARISPIDARRGRGYMVMMFDDLTVYSCYCSPNFTTEEFTKFLDGVETEVR